MLSQEIRGFIYFVIALNGNSLSMICGQKCQWYTHILFRNIFRRAYRLFQIFAGKGPRFSTRSMIVYLVTYNALQFSNGNLLFYMSFSKNVAQFAHNDENFHRPVLYVGHASIISVTCVEFEKVCP